MKPSEPSIHYATDQALRIMRDFIYPPQCENQIQSDDSWNMVKAHWRKDQDWLIEQYNKEKTRK